MDNYKNRFVGIAYFPMGPGMYLRPPLPQSRKKDARAKMLCPPLPEKKPHGEENDARKGPDLPIR